MTENSTSIQVKVAYQILQAFEKNYRWFNRITRGAQQRFEQGNYLECQRAARERIAIYQTSEADVVAEIYQLIHPHQQNLSFWQGLKEAYASLLDGHLQPELAETFFNSVVGRIFKHGRIDDSMMFILPRTCMLSALQRDFVVNSFDTSGTVGDMMQAILETYRFNIPFADVQTDLQSLETALHARLSRKQLALVHTVEILKPIFFRGTAAYLVGRICMPQETLPFVIALMTDDKQQLVVDALLTERRHLSVLFGFARAYFMADTDYPAAVVSFLQELLPNKKHFELYTALGHHKHGKTVFYRGFLQHLDNSEDLFEAAPGIRGLVMAVFHLPSYGIVFKIIKDEFPESKKITREHVKDCYRLVKTSDRIGRMADTHEYVNFRLPLKRMAPELLSELKQDCAGSIEIEGDEIIIRHLYIERKMTPLNLYLEQQTDPEKTRDALNDLGLCIKQIAAANIFPGDMLHKNFGITRHGRVIFYDYDEICLMNQRQFRDLPKSDDPFALDTLSVSPEDVFPEQFRHFIVGKKHLKEQLMNLHPELTSPEYWRKIQAEASQGKVQHFKPYPEEQCFTR